MNAAIATKPALDTEKRDEFADRLFESTLGALDLVTVYLGEHLGLYRALADRGASTSAELAQATGTTERYAREWLEQQAASAIVEVDDARLPARRRRYTLPPEHAEVLLDSDSLAYVGPLGRLVVGMARPVQAVGEAFRSGGGVPWEAYGDDVRTAQADFNRPQFLNLLASEWLPAMPDVHEHLQADPPAHVADIACGAGWSSIAIAKGYPKVTVEGFDLDAPSIDAARLNALREGVSDRVHFAVADAAETAFEGRYDLVTVFEALHDMSHPVDALRTVHRLVAKDGAVLVMDERVAEAFELPTTETERFLYQCSVLLCLPNGMAEQPSAATGTVMRAETMQRYAEAAGFSSVTVLPIEHELFRFYRLKPKP
jgi:ubiquinone/menaquinone biosynthesis C-methylase UbiE